MAWYHPSSLLDKIFEGGIIIKGVTGAFEFIGGALLLFISPSTIHRFLVFATQDDPNSKFANVLLSSTHNLGGSRAFLIIYLWIHAAIKLVAVIGILRNHLWAYPFSLISLGALMLYQLYSIFFVKPSVGMILLTIFDAFILWLIWREYGKVRPTLSHAGNSQPTK
jgi:uncharacterized membrane protein